MKLSKLSKNAEWTSMCVAKKYSSTLKAYKIYIRSQNRLFTQKPIRLIQDLVIFKYVPGKPMIDCHWITCERYLNRYVSMIQPLTGLDAQLWAFKFYCEGDRGEHMSVIERIPTILNGNWHGDMCMENVICSGQSMTDIDLREDGYGDVYYDLAKFNRSLLYNSLTDQFTATNPSFKRWVLERGFDWDAVQLVTAIVFRRMGKLHNRKDFIERGDELCRV